jgi:hypothetical protein
MKSLELGVAGILVSVEAEVSACLAGRWVLLSGRDVRGCGQHDSQG